MRATGSNPFSREFSSLEMVLVKVMGEWEFLLDDILTIWA